MTSASERKKLIIYLTLNFKMSILAKIKKYPLGSKFFSNDYLLS